MHNHSTRFSSPVARGGEHRPAEGSEGQNGRTYLRSERLPIEELLRGTPLPNSRL